MIDRNFIRLTSLNSANFETVRACAITSRLEPAKKVA
jgi:hypothetical protein